MCLRLVWPWEGTACSGPNRSRSSHRLEKSRNGTLLRATASLPIPHLGHSFDLSLQLDDYAVNTGLDDALFTGAPPRAGAAESR